MGVPAIRAYYLAKELARDFDVTLFAERVSGLQEDDLRVVELAATDPRVIRRAIAPFDAVVATNLPLPVMRWLATTDKQVIYDLYVPYFAEYLALADALPERSLDRMFSRWTALNQRYPLTTGNAFVCPSERQRDLWLGMLAALGRVDFDAYRRDPTLRSLVDVVPFGLPSEAPRKTERVLKGVVPGIRETDRVLLWAGGIWNWFDPLTVIRAVAELAGRRDDVKLFFLGVVPPGAPQSLMSRRAIALAEELGVSDRFVFFNRDWVPYERREEYLLEADLGVSAHFDTLETRFAYRTRLLDYFWAGLPTITTVGDELGELVAKRDLGRAVATADVAGWVGSIETLLDDQGASERARANLAHVREELTWTNAAKPLVRLVARPGERVSPGFSAARLELDDIRMRLRISLSLGGPTGVLRRQARKLVGRRR